MKNVLKNAGNSLVPKPMISPLHTQVVIAQNYCLRTVSDPGKEDVIITILTWHKPAL